jgi:carbonic anhydrase
MFSYCSSKTQAAESTELLIQAQPGQQNGLTREDTLHAHGIRTQADGSVPPEKALQKLRQGNSRYVEGTPQQRSFDQDARQALAQHGQNPFATIIGCADSRCPLEILFDVQPGDIFVLRNAGNTCTHAEGSMVGSVEYSVGHLHTSLILVLGHTRCGAIAGATATALSKMGNSQNDTQPSSTLDKLLAGLGPVALQAKSELPACSTVEEVAAHAVKVNVFHTIEKLLTYSKPLREKVRQGDVVVQGAIYDIVSGKVEFLGACLRQALVLDMDAALVVPVPPVEDPTKESKPVQGNEAALAKTGGA